MSIQWDILLWLGDGVIHCLAANEMVGSGSRLVVGGTNLSHTVSTSPTPITWIGKEGGGKEEAEIWSVEEYGI